MRINITNVKTGEPLELRLRDFQPSRDMDTVAAAISPDSGQLEAVRKTLLKSWRRFPWGFHVIETLDGKFAAAVQLGFFKPWWLVMALGRQPVAVPRLICRILAALRVLREFELSNIYVSEEYRGTGLSRYLMALIEEIAAGQWRQKSIMLLVRRENVPAVKLYTALGYRTREIFSKRGIEKLLMVKELGRSPGKTG